MFEISIVYVLPKQEITEYKSDFEANPQRRYFVRLREDSERLIAVDPVLFLAHRNCSPMVQIVVKYFWIGHLPPAPEPFYRLLVEEL